LFFSGAMLHQKAKKSPTLEMLLPLKKIAKG
jgi:hypothetical protein